MFNKIITRDILENLAGAAAFERGLAYFSAASVEDLNATDNKITALVEGTESYQVELSDNNGLSFHCTCPRAANGYFCKHCVAVGLAWLSSSKVADSSVPAKKPRDVQRTIREYLYTQAPEVLIALLLDTAKRDKLLKQALTLKAERAAGGANSAKAFRKAIDKATRVRGFMDWREARGFAANLDQLVASLAELLTPEASAMLVELAEYALERVEKSLEEIDDSSGDIGSIVSKLGDLHLSACELAKPDPEPLADRLFHLETTSPFGICSFSPMTYRDALGELGLRRYRELAEIEWGKLKPSQNNDKYDSYRFHITRIMESLAAVSGNLEELVAIKSRDLSSAYQYLTIAELWSKTGESDKALEWAERGLQAFPKATDNRLRDFLVAIYLQRNCNDEALQLTWIQFEERATLDYYKKLHTLAEVLGIWPEQRERALARVGEVIANAAAFTNHWKRQPSIPDYSLRIEIALWEDDLNTAWITFHAGTCSKSLQITLAGRLEATHPDDALTLYQQVILPTVEETNNAAYAYAIKLIRRVETILNTQDRNHEFGEYVAALRTRFKPKKNFIKLLDELIGNK